MQIGKGIFLTLTITIIGFFSLSNTAFADTATYTEDFSSSTYYDNANSGVYSSWLNGSQLIFDTTNSTPAPYFYKPDGTLKYTAQFGQYVYGGFVAAGVGDREMYVFDTVSSTYTNIDISTWTTSFMNEMTVYGDYLYITNGTNYGAQGGLAIIDINDTGTPTNPLFVTNYTSIANASYIHIAPGYANPSETYAYVVSNSPNPKLTIIDITDPKNSFIRGSIALPSGASYYDLTDWNYIALIGNSAGTGVTAVNTYDPDNLALVTVNLVGIDAGTVRDVEEDSYSLLLTQTNGTGDGQLVTAEPLIAGGVITITGTASYTFSSTTHPWRAVTDGTYYYTLSQDTANGAQALNSFTIDIPGGTIAAQGSTQISNSTVGNMLVYGGNAWIGNQLLGLAKVDLSDVTNPGTPLYNTTQMFDALDVVYYNDQLVIASGTDSGGGGRIMTEDLADPTSVYSNSGAAPGGGGCSLNRLHVGDVGVWWICGSYFGYWDTGHVGYELDTGIASLSDITTSGNYAYVADATNQKLLTFDVSTSTFTQVHSLSTVAAPTAITTDGDYVYVAAGANILVYDISTPSAPSYVRTHNAAGNTPADLAVEGDYLFVLGSKLTAILKTNLINPLVVPLEYPTADLGPLYKRMLIQDGYAYLGENSLGSGDVRIFNVQDPTAIDPADGDGLTLHPELASTGGLAGGFAVNDGWLYIADGATDGIRSVKLSYPRIQQVKSIEVDTVASTNNITAVNYTFTTEPNNGTVQYYLSNNNGLNWQQVASSSASSVTGTYTFTTTGSQLRWEANVYSDATINGDLGSYGTTPVITDVVLEYTYNAIPADTTPPTSTANPSSGTFAGSFSATLIASDDNPGSTIYYTTDGSTPTTASSSCSSGCFVLISSTSTLKFFAVDAAGNIETSINSSNYTVTSSVPDTTAPVSAATILGSEGPFNGAINVTIITVDDSDTNPTIYYTTDGSDASTSPTEYSGPINVTADTILTWFAVDASGNQESPQHQEVYEINEEVPDTTAPDSVANPIGATFSSSISVVLSKSDDSDPNPTIYYTTNGTTPTTTSFIYTDPITLNIDTVIKFFARDASGNTETINTETYVIGGEDTALTVTPTVGAPELDPEFVTDTTTPVVWARPEDGTYEAAQTIHLFATDNLDPNPTIYYTLNGVTPSAAAFVYTGPFPITTTTTIKFIAIDAAGNISSVAQETYTITGSVTDNTAPTVSATACDNGFFDIAEDIVVSAEDDYDENPTIFYTVDSTTPSAFGFTYTTPITMANTATIKFFARDASGNTSSVSSTECTIYSSAMAIRAKNKKKGKGTVRITKKGKNKVLTKWQAFKKGGVKADIVKVRGVKRVAAIQYKKSNVLKIFDLNGNLLGKKKFRKKKALHKLEAANFYRGAKNGEIMVAQLNKKKGELVTRAFNVTKTNKPKIRVKTTVNEGLDTLITKGYRLQFKKKGKLLLVKTKKGKKAQLKLKMTKKGSKYRLRVI